MVATTRPTPVAQMTPQEVADLFDVSTKTVGRWADRGLLPVERTPGGHRRFRSTDVAALLDALGVVGVR